VPVYVHAKFADVSSVNGLGGVGQNSLYAAAKGGIALTKSAAQEYASRGIRVNALVAGGFRTPMLECVFARVAPENPAAAAESLAGLVPICANLRIAV
jgi:NAD(P)-dependent dehydrogenase (short-subunit alcohol dehydrogenase family)